MIRGSSAILLSHVMGLAVIFGFFFYSFLLQFFSLENCVPVQEMEHVLTPRFVAFKSVLPCQ